MERTFKKHDRIKYTVREPKFWKDRGSQISTSHPTETHYYGTFISYVGKSRAEVELTSPSGRVGRIVVDLRRIELVAPAPDCVGARYEY